MRKTINPFRMPRPSLLYFVRRWVTLFSLACFEGKTQRENTTSNLDFHYQKVTEKLG